MTRRVTAVVCLLLTAGAMAARAQAVSLKPSFGTSVVFDDNLYHQPVGEGDVIVRFSPRLDAVYKSERLALSSRYALDAERFDRHPALTTARGRQEASFDAGYSASRRFSLGAAAAFAETHTPADLNAVTALTPGRVRARRLTLNPSATYAAGPRATASLGYLVTSETLQGGVGLTTESATVALEHRGSARHSLRVEYLDQHFQFAGAGTPSSRALTGEWTRDVTRGTALTLRVGPRLTSGVLSPEIAASARHLLRAGGVAVSYLETQTTLIGLAGLARARSVTATADGDLRPGVTLRAGSGVLQARQAGLSSIAYRVSASCAWRPAGRMEIEAGYEAEVQRGNLYTAQVAQTSQRHVATLTFIVVQTAAPLRGRE
jgi:uncharacterized protein (PEP-CTERM system associated)